MILSQPVLRDIRRMVVFPAFRGTLGVVVVVTAHLQQSFVVEPVCVAVCSRDECRRCYASEGPTLSVTWLSTDQTLSGAVGLNHQLAGFGLS